MCVVWTAGVGAGRAAGPRVDTRAPRVAGSGDGSACPVDGRRRSLLVPAASTAAEWMSTDLSPAVGRSGVERSRCATDDDARRPGPATRRVRLLQRSRCVARLAQNLDAG